MATAKIRCLHPTLRTRLRSHCPFINAVCYKCDRKGHIKAVCRSSGKPVRKGKIAQHIVEQLTENSAVYVFFTSTLVDKPQILLQISNVDLVFELDSGAAVSLVGPYIWKRIRHWIATLDVAKDPTFQLWQASDSGQRRMQRQCVIQWGKSDFAIHRC